MDKIKERKPIYFHYIALFHNLFSYHLIYTCCIHSSNILTIYVKVSLHTITLLYWNIIQKNIYIFKVCGPTIWILTIQRSCLGSGFFKLLNALQSCFLLKQHSQQLHCWAKAAKEHCTKRENAHWIVHIELRGELTVLVAGSWL